jgi:hypothetical protein
MINKQFTKKASLLPTPQSLSLLLFFFQVLPGLKMRIDADYSPPPPFFNEIIYIVLRGCKYCSQWQYMQVRIPKFAL